MAKPNNDLEEIRRKNRERVRRFRERKRIERELVKRGISMRTIEENAGTDYDRLKTFVVSTLGEGVAATIINDAATGAMRKNTIGSTGDQGGSGSASKSAGVSKRQSKRKGRRSRRRDSEDESTEEEEEEEDDFDELYGALTEEEGDSSPAKAQKSSSKAPVATTAASTASTSTAERATPAKNKSRTARTGLKSLVSSLFYFSLTFENSLSNSSLSSSIRRPLSLHRITRRQRKNRHIATSTTHFSKKCKSLPCPLATTPTMTLKREALET